MTLRVHRRAATAALLVALVGMAALAITSSMSAASASSAQGEELTSTTDVFITEHDVRHGIVRHDSTSGSVVDDLGSTALDLDAAFDVAFGPDGLLYVSDSTSNTVERFNIATDSHLDTFISSETASTAGLDHPTGLAFSPAGDLLVASGRSGDVLRFDGTTGAFISTATAGGQPLRYPVAIAIDSSGDLYVADAYNDDIELFSGSTGKHLGTFATFAPGASPSDIVFTDTGDLLVALEGAGQLVVLSDEGDARELVTGDLESPSGLALGPDDAIWVADYWNDSIRRFDIATGDPLDTPGFDDTLRGPRRLTFFPPDPAALGEDDAAPDAEPTRPLTAEEWSESVDGDQPVEDLTFASNDGVAEPELDFVAESDDYVAVIADTGVLLDVDGADEPIEMILTDADAAAPTAASGESAVAFDDVYPGIDAVYSANGTELEYSFIVEPGADVDEITLDFDGVRAVRVADNGDLFLDSPDGPDLLSTAPFTYQFIDGARITVSSDYEIRGDGSVGFTVGAYDTTRSLVIDPTLTPAVNLLMVTSNGAFGSGNDAAKKTLFEGWGWTVTGIDDNSSAGAFASAAAANDVLFLSDSAGSGFLIVADLNIGMVVENYQGWPSALYSPTNDTNFFATTFMNLVDNTHYITLPFATGSMSIDSGSGDLNFWESDVNPLPVGVEVLAESPASSNDDALLVAETGATLYSANTAPNRRVWFPSDATDPAGYTADYETLLERSLAWATGQETPGCADADGDGLCDDQEDANTDADNDPATNPGPDTDGDTTPNYLDADDDGDSTPTASENADPNGDGDPRDAHDSDRDGQPDYLDDPSGQTTGRVGLEQKISSTQGGLTGPLVNFDYFGTGVTSIGDLDGDGVNDIAVGAPLDDDGGTNRGAVHILFMNANGTVKSEQKISETAGGFTTPLGNEDYFGVSVTRLGDLDGDGINDIAVGAALDDDGGTDQGAIYVLFLNTDGTVKAEQKISETQGGLSGPLDAIDWFGNSVTNIGDVDGDGTNDIAIGVWRDDDGGTDRGAIYVLFLNPDGTVKDEQKISSTTGGFTGPLDNGDYFGTGVSGIGDLDGDGIPDIATGAQLDDDGGTDQGAIYVLFLNADGTVRAEQKISETQGGLMGTLDPSDWFGTSVAGMGDLDGDGINDIATGVWQDDDGGTDQGAAYVLFLNADGTVKAEQKISEIQGGLTGPLDASDYFGISVAGLGDHDGDGTPDLAIGAQLDDDGGTDRGAVYILHLEGLTDSDGDGLWDHEEDANTDADNDPATNPGPDTDGDTLPNYLDADDDGDGALTSSAAEAADPNGDGDPSDARDSDHDGQPDYLDQPISVATDGDVADEVKISDAVGGFTPPLDDTDLFGSAITSVGDLDGDGTEDLAVGVPNDDDGGPNRGAAFVLFMNSDGTVRASQKISDTQGGFAAALANADLFGSSVAGIGDINGDGVNDMAVGASRGEADDSGALHILFLDVDGTVQAEQKISNGVGGLVAALDNADYFGSSVTGLGDIDGDGVNDIAIGAPGDDDAGTGRGAAYILFLNANGTVKAEQKVSDTSGGFPTPLDDNDAFGASLASIGDLDGNGIGDLAVGAPKDDDADPAVGANHGAVHVLLLASDGTVQSTSKISDTSGNLGTPLGSGDEFGTSIAGIGDANIDGVPDLVVGAPYDDDGAGDRGAAFVLFLNNDGTVKEDHKISDTDGGLVTALGNSDWFGFAVAGMGDPDGDGTIAIAVGAPNDDDSSVADGGNNRGAFYVLDLSASTACSDSDGDGLCDHEEDANTDADNDPATNPGPDTDGDTLPNYLDADDDGDGTPTAAENADPNGDGDPRDSLDADHDGQPDYLDLPTVPTDGTVATEQKISDTQGGFTATLDNSDWFGVSVASVGDLDGDGTIDIAAGSLQDDDGGFDRGAVYILFLNPNGTVKAEQKISDTQGGFTATLDNSDWFGVSVASVGDLDGDGTIEIAVGSLQDDDGGFDRGAVYILFLNPNGTVRAEQKISSTAGGLSGPLDNNDFFGMSVAGIGDLDGDGIPDLSVGARFDDDGGTDRGAAYVLFLNADGTVKSEQKISDTQGGFTATLDNDDWFGYATSGVGDLDGDGTPDLAVSARYDDDGGTDRGAVHILFMNPNGTVRAEQKISSATGGLTGPLDNGDNFGTTIARVGDLDRDGTSDLAVGARLDDDGGTDRGAAYILFMNPNGTVKAEQKISDTQGGFTATLDNSDNFASGIAGIGDLDGDGTINLAMGSYNDDDGGTDRGSLYIVDLTSSDPTVVVNSTGDASDASPGDGLCDTGGTNSAGDPECTLRAAIEESNALASDTTVIAFDIPTSDAGHDAGVWTITPTGVLPDITATVVLDGSSQPGYATPTAVFPASVDGAPSIVVDRSATGGGSNALRLAAGADFSVVRGLSIVGSGGTGVRVDAPDVSIVGNWIGVTPDGGTADILSRSVNVEATAIDVVVGGASAPDRNVFAADGLTTLELYGNGAAVRGNEFVGGGTYGVFVSGSATGVMVGGTAATDGNIITGLTGDGVLPFLNTQVAVLGNRIFGNGDLGIDLAGDGVTPNDAGDVDTGPNGLLNVPVVTSTSQAAGTVTVDFDLDVPAGDYRIEAFSNPSGIDASGSGEGEIFETATTITHAGSGVESFQLTFPSSSPDGVALTATEESVGPTYGATSEFSLTTVCPDSDGDGLCDREEDANIDADDDPTTNPGPDTDGDTLPNYLDADDDGDGTPTVLENADPNADGDPRDALDSDHDGQPDYLDVPTGKAVPEAVEHTKISSTQGGLVGPLDISDSFGGDASSIGDVDGDGIVDLAVGAHLDDDGAGGSGAVYILFMNPDGTVRAEQRSVPLKAA